MVPLLSERKGKGKKCWSRIVEKKKQLSNFGSISPKKGRIYSLVGVEETIIYVGSSLPENRKSSLD